MQLLTDLSRAKPTPCSAALSSPRSRDLFFPFSSYGENFRGFTTTPDAIHLRNFPPVECKGSRLRENPFGGESRICALLAQSDERSGQSCGVGLRVKSNKPESQRDFVNEKLLVVQIFHKIVLDENMTLLLSGTICL